MQMQEYYSQASEYTPAPIMQQMTTHDIVASPQQPARQLATQAQQVVSQVASHLAPQQPARQVTAEKPTVRKNRE